jgi:hypothetical protein
MYNPGERVYYTSPNGIKMNGIVKEVREKISFVVFHCNEDWANYKDYTGQSCDIYRLDHGWVDKNGYLLEEYCDHEYRPDAGKWQPINRMSCIYTVEKSLMIDN